MNSFDEGNGVQSRRSFVKKAAYVAPVILTLQANSAFASYGSSGSSAGDSRQGNAYAWAWGKDKPKKAKKAKS